MGHVNRDINRGLFSSADIFKRINVLCHFSGERANMLHMEFGIVKITSGHYRTEKRIGAEREAPSQLASFPGAERHCAGCRRKVTRGPPAVEPARRATHTANKPGEPCLREQ